MYYLFRWLWRTLVVYVHPNQSSPWTGNFPAQQSTLGKATPCSSVSSIASNITYPSIGKNNTIRMSCIIVSNLNFYLFLVMITLGMELDNSERDGPMGPHTSRNARFSPVTAICTTLPSRAKEAHFCGMHTFYGWGRLSMAPLSSYRN